MGKKRFDAAGNLSLLIGQFKRYPLTASASLAIALLFSGFSAFTSLSKPPEIAGIWRVELAEHVPPLLQDWWQQGSTFFAMSNGRIAEVPRPGERPDIYALIGPDLCWTRCYTLTTISLDYRVAPPTNYDVDVRHLPSRLEFFGPAGMRIVAIKQ